MLEPQGFHAVLVPSCSDNAIVPKNCCAAELEEIVAETQKVSPQVDAYIAENGVSNGKKSSNKNAAQANDIERQ